MTPKTRAEALRLGEALDLHIHRRRDGRFELWEENNCRRRLNTQPLKNLDDVARFLIFWSIGTVVTSPCGKFSARPLVKRSASSMVIANRDLRAIAIEMGVIPKAQATLAPDRADNAGQSYSPPPASRVVPQDEQRDIWLAALNLPNDHSVVLHDMVMAAQRLARARHWFPSKAEFRAWVDNDAGLSSLIRDARDYRALLRIAKRDPVETSHAIAFYEANHTHAYPRAVLHAIARRGEDWVSPEACRDDHRALWLKRDVLKRFPPCRVQSPGRPLSQREADNFQCWLATGIRSWSVFHADPPKPEPPRAAPAKTKRRKVETPEEYMRRVDKRREYQRKRSDDAALGKRLRAEAAPFLSLDAETVLNDGE